jgi:dihydrofolate reductase
VVEGRGSFEVGLAAGVDDAYPDLRHLVVSSTLAAPLAAGIELVADDPLGRVRALKQEDGKDIWLVGGGELAGALYDGVDELVLKLNPVTFGTGVPLFGRRAAFNLRHWARTAIDPLESGTTFITYRRR